MKTEYFSNMKAFYAHEVENQVQWATDGPEIRVFDFKENGRNESNSGMCGDRQVT